LEGKNQKLFILPACFILRLGYHFSVSPFIQLPLAKFLKRMDAKRISDSFIIMNEIVLPNDTNTFGNLMGGRLMYWMDIAAGMASGKHCSAPCMTASVDNLSFKNPIKLGNIVHIEAQVSRAFNTSMEIYLKVWGEDLVHQYRYESNEAYFTFVALDPTGNPRKVPQLIPETEAEKNLYEGAMRRRQVRLILGGKMKPDDANELKALFYPPATT
jgi:acyl-CoA hydrolase